MIPQAVLEAYGLSGRVERLGHGLINATYLVSDAAGEPVAVVQRLHTIFSPEVNQDLQSITGRMLACGMLAPMLIPTADGELCFTLEGQHWRALTYIAGQVFSQLNSAAQASSAGRLVGRFHFALRDFVYRYSHVRAGVHDTAQHLARLKQALARPEADARARELGQRILATVPQLPALLPTLPLQHAHGDLKISNVLFAGDGLTARALLDFDTCGRLTMAYELGDMLRSWCNPAGEDDAAPALEPTLLFSALEGHADGVGGRLTEAEIASIVPGLQTVCVELAARFVTDAIEDTYFGWDPTRFPSRSEHNLLRARGQLELAQSALRQDHTLRALVRRAFA
jgi:Ser/Thr protein kinase RdoA (MazF antagonist)